MTVELDDDTRWRLTSSWCTMDDHENCKYTKCQCNSCDGCKGKPMPYMKPAMKAAPEPKEEEDDDDA